MRKKTYAMRYVAGQPAERIFPPGAMFHLGQALPKPSSLRIELNTGGYRNYVPDWEANTWKPSQGSNNLYRNGAMPMSMTESFPPADGPSATEEGVPDEIKDALLNPYAVQGRG